MYKPGQTKEKVNIKPQNPLLFKYEDEKVLSGDSIRALVSRGKARPSQVGCQTSEVDRPEHCSAHVGTHEMVKET